MMGFCAIGIVHTKTPTNLGTLLRSAHAFGAGLVFTVGKRYERQASDTTNATLHVPTIHCATIHDLVEHLPFGCKLVGVEITQGATDLRMFKHPERACYLLGAEDRGLSREEMAVCHEILAIRGASACLNVSVAGSIVLYDRVANAQRLARMEAA